VKKLALLLIPATLLVSGCSGQGMSDEQFEELKYEQREIAYKQCLVEHNGFADACRLLKP